MNRREKGGSMKRHRLYVCTYLASDEYKWKTIFVFVIRVNACAFNSNKFLNPKGTETAHNFTLSIEYFSRIDIVVTTLKTFFVTGTNFLVDLELTFQIGTS